MIHFAPVGINLLGISPVRPGRKWIEIITDKAHDFSNFCHRNTHLPRQIRIMLPTHGCNPCLNNFSCQHRHHSSLGKDIKLDQQCILRGAGPNTNWIRTADNIMDSVNPIQWNMKIAHNLQRGNGKQSIIIKMRANEGCQLVIFRLKFGYHLTQHVLCQIFHLG